mgnify:CR=1 FL=1
MKNNLRKINNNKKPRGGEGLVDIVEIGPFSETTSASFSVDMVFGAVDGVDAGDNKQSTFDYQFNIGLTTSFTGEDGLDIGIDLSGSNGTTTMGQYLGVPTTDDTIGLDGLNLTYALGGATVSINDNGDSRDLINGNCDDKSYTALTSYLDNWNCNVISGSTASGVGLGFTYNFDNGFTVAAGTTVKEDNVGESYGLSAAYESDVYGLAVSYVIDDYTAATVDNTTTWGVNGYYTFDAASLSVGYETQESGGIDKDGYFVGLSFPEVGPGSVNIGLATTELSSSTDTEYLTYEASYSYPVNDGMTITPGVAYAETEDGDVTVFAVKTSFSF